MEEVVVFEADKAVRSSGSVWKVAVFLVGLVLLGASCTGSSDSKAASETSLDPLNPTTQATVEVEPTSTTDRRQVDTREGGDPLERYAAYIEAYNVAAGPPFADSTYMPLLELTRENQLKGDIDYLNNLKEEGKVLLFPKPTIDKHVLSELKADFVNTDPNLHFFEDCHYTDLYLDQPGATKSSTPRTIVFTVEMIRDNKEAEWRVNAVQQETEAMEGKGECVK